jgi:polyisoprenoid-binding protein YceI
MKIKSILSSLILTVLIALGFTAPASAADIYKIDTEGRHYYAGFQISHLGYSIMHGRFDEISGTIEYDSANPTASTVSVTLDVTSINTNHPKRDAHLQSPDFFNAAEFSEITFVSTKLEQTGENTGKVTGDLTMLGVTKSVTLETTLLKIGAHPFNQAPIAAWSARGTIKRSDFGINYGLPAIGDEVTLLIDIEALKQ